MPICAVTLRTQLINSCELSLQYSNSYLDELAHLNIPVFSVRLNTWNYCRALGCSV